MAFVLSNRAFPAELPSNTEKQCLFIMRIENGSITDLVDKFLNITRGWKLPPGTIMVVSSATQLERCSIAAYTAALANNGGRVQRVFSGQIEWIPRTTNSPLRYQLWGAHTRPGQDGHVGKVCTS